MERKSYLTVLGLLALLLTWLSGCDDSPVFPVEPKAEFVDIQPRELLSNAGDSVLVTIRFQDGDGDLGALGPDSANLILLDSRFSEGRIPTEELAQNPFTIPSLTPDAKNPSIQGEITVKLQFIVSLLPEGQRDSIRYQVILRDRAGNLATPLDGGEEAIWTDYIYVTRE
jgi:hypothetical protein